MLNKSDHKSDGRRNLVNVSRYAKMLVRRIRVFTYENMYGLDKKVTI